jgi:hypothetical protein
VKNRPVQKNDNTEDQIFRKNTDFFQDEGDTVIEVEENERFDGKTSSWGSQFLLNSDPLRQCFISQISLYKSYN